MKNPNWQNFLASQGLLALEGNEQRSSYTSEDNLICPLPHYDLLVASGPDAQQFLQGQCTCDLRKLNEMTALLGGHCSAKGRMLSSFFMAHIDPEHIGLRVHTSISDYALAQFKKYIVFAKAKIEIDENWLCFGLFVNSDRKPQVEKIIDLPQADLGFIRNKNYTIIRHRESQYELWITTDFASELWQPLTQTLGVGTAEIWDFANISAGIAEIRIGNEDRLVPQVLNFDLAGGISFDKGCFTGQEIVARLRYKGRPKKHLYRISTDVFSQLPEPGVEIIDSQTKQAIGQVILTSKNKTSFEMLVVLNDEYANTEMPLNFGSSEPIKLQWHSLPYAIT